MTFPSILIAGAQRCGKSILAARLAGIAGGRVLKLDELRNREFPETLPTAERQQAAARAVARALAEQPAGLVIEGAALYNLCKAGLAAGSFGAPVYFLGFTGKPAEKRRGIDAFRATGRCWTLRRGMGPDDLEALARSQILLSRRQKRFCAERNIPFLEINPGTFHADIEAAARTILDTLEAPRPAEAVAGADGQLYRCSRHRPADREVRGR